MKISLKTKKAVLKGVLSILVAGYLTAFMTSQETNADNSDKNVVLASTVSASTLPEVELPNTKKLVFKQNITSISEKINSAAVKKEKIRKIKSYLSKRGAPMADQAENFVVIADKYGLPYNLMPAIAVIESGAGKANYRPYNYAGMGGQSNAYVFSSYLEAIETHAKLIKKGYWDKGARTPEQMEPYYCYNCPTWGEKVQGVMNAIDAQ